ncbi:MAG: AMP-binding protein [Tetrasphaera sp.]
MPVAVVVLPEPGSIALAARLLAPPVAAEDLAYVLYISGSTGTPKGVCVEHGQVASYLDSVAHLFPDADLGAAGAVASAEFDYSLHELLLPLTRGGCLVLAEDAFTLPEHPAYGQLTLLHGVPTPMALLLERPLPASVRTVVFGGEALPLPLPLIERAFANPGVERVLNMYGPTETTIACTGIVFRREDPPRATIGAPLPGVTAAVLDADLQPVAGKAVGELWIGGNRVARGYLGEPERTATAFRDGIPALPGRAYRTGDLVSWSGGELVYHGRLDDQVKVRGHRVEPAEVETALLGIPGVGQAAALVVTTAAGAELAAVLVPEHPGLDVESVRAAAAARLPEFLLPGRFVVVEALPLTTAGKADQRALAALVAAATGDPRPVGMPYDPGEQAVAHAVAGVLGGLPDPARPLAAQGLHSLGAARAAAALATATGKLLQPGDFLGEATIGSAAAALQSARVTAAPSEDVTAAVGDRVPLTATQRRLWVRRQLADDPAVTAVAARLHLDPDPGTAALGAALTRLTELHPSLRTAVRESAGGPVGEVLAPGFDLHDLRGGRGTPDEFLRVAVTLDGSTPPLRAALVEPDTRQAGIDVIIHADHLALDGWSLGVVAAQLAELLAELERIIAGGQRIDDPLGVGAPGAPVAGRGRRIIRGHPWSVDDIDAYAARLGVSPAAVHVAVTATLLARLGRLDDLLLGVAVAQRHRPGTDTVVAPLLTVLPLRMQIDPDRIVEAVIRDAGEALQRTLRLIDLDPDAVATAAAWADLPPGALPLPVLLTVQPDGPVTASAAGQRVDIAGEMDCGSSQADLTIMINAGSAGPELIVEHDTTRVPDGGAVADFADRYVRVLHAMLAAPRAPLAELPILSPAELDRLDRLTEGPPLASGLVDVTQRIWAAAQRHPGQVATETASLPGPSKPPERLTYRDLVHLAARTATILRAAGVRPGDTVAVALPRDARLPAALLGVLAAGAAYQPWHPGYPPARLAFLAADAGVGVVLTCPQLRDVVAAVPVADPVTVVDLPGPDSPDDPIPAPPPAWPDESAAYVLHTSGSTGTPKGVPVSRRNLSWLTHSVLQAAVVPAGSRVLLTTSLTFDISVAELWPALICGGTVVVAPDELARDGAKFAAVLDANAAGAIQATPNGLRVLTDGGWRGGDVAVLSCGEPLPADVAGKVVTRARIGWNLLWPHRSDRLCDRAGHDPRARRRCGRPGSTHVDRPASARRARPRCRARPPPGSPRVCRAVVDRRPRRRCRLPGPAGADRCRVRRHPGAPHGRVGARLVCHRRPGLLAPRRHLGLPRTAGRTGQGQRLPDRTGGGGGLPA